MVEDIVRKYGFLTLGSRLKRIGERLQADTQRIMAEMGVALQASQYPFLGALDRLGPLTIGELADAVGITQPGATRVVSQLMRLGLVKARQTMKDQRRRIVSLTKKGQALVDRSKREVWPRIECAVADLCGEFTGPLLDQLAALEDGLAALPLDRRGKPSARKRR
jgi:DNA-binding MarR family transcriptional regulator